jgi:hypothetical protein
MRFGSAIARRVLYSDKNTNCQNNADTAYDSKTLSHYISSMNISEAYWPGIEP